MHTMQRATTFNDLSDSCGEKKQDLEVVEQVTVTEKYR